MSDSRSFSRNLAGFGLIAGPVLFAIGNLVDPAWGDDAAAYLTDVEEGKGRYLLAGVLWTVGSLVFIAGTLGVARLLRGRRVTLGQVAAGLLTLGLIGLSAGMAFNGLDTVLAEADNRDAAVAIYDAVEDNAAVVIYWMFFFIVGVALGSILLAVALFRRRIVPIWSPILIVLSLVVGFVGDNQVLGAVAFLMLAAALFPLARLMFGMTDEQWARWEPLEEVGRPAGAPAAEPQPAVT